MTYALYVQATGANAVPELKKVIVAFSNRIAISDTLPGALAMVFGHAPETLEEGPGDAGAGTGVSDEVTRLLEEAAQAFADADAALRDGDAVEHRRKLEEGRRLFEEARQEEAGQTEPGDQDGGQ